jgi:hypothetical protein
LFFVTELDENTMILIEAETSAAFGKNDLEVRPDPLRAYKNAVLLAGQLSRAMADGLAKAHAGTDNDTAVTFGLRVDSNGSVMIAQSLDKAQIHITVRRSGGSRG